MNPQSNIHSTVAPWPSQDDDPGGRKLRGMAIAAQVKIEKNRLGYKVPSQSANGSYLVNLDGGEPFCTCFDFEVSQESCEHIFAVGFVIQREERLGDGPAIMPEADLRAEPKIEFRGQSVRCGRDWPAYNAAQTNERRHFATLLRELCDTVPQPAQTIGRPRLPVGDMLFAAGLKVYGTMSGRRTMTDVRDAYARGQLQQVPSVASIFRCFENPDLTSVLRSLIEQSALPLNSVEVDFAVDASGFSSSVYDSWFKNKWGRKAEEAQWVKAHVICGVKTNIITAAEVTSGTSNDSPHLAPFVEITAENFPIEEVSADKAYLSKRNLRAVDAVGGTAYIPFKSTSVAHDRKRKRDTVWERAFHFYNLHREEFCEHYHKRSNVEATFSMIKAKFGGSVRSRGPTAQMNEVLTKILCHNICVLIRSMYELGIMPVFDTESVETAKVAA